MKISRIYLAALIAVSCMVATLISISGAAFSQSGTPADPTDAGKHVFQRANCMGCHKWHGNGGGGYGGDALSLRQTQLTREQIVETVSCGRPGTGMPFFVRGSYDATKCYDMLRKDAGDQMPPEANVFLRPSEIEAVADYVIAHIKGKGEPTYDECTAFFGNGSRVCNVYKTEAKPAEAEQAKKAAQ
jgi:mono/diheme cytochrome c family protein